MAFYQGKLMRISVDGQTIFHEVDCTLSGSTDFKDIATKDTDGTESTQGSKSWNISVNGFVATGATAQEDIKSMSDLWNAQTLVAITLSDDVVGSVIFSGNGYIEGFSVGAPNDETVTFDYTIKGNGALTVGLVTV